MKLTLEIDSDNAAFQDGNAGSETARILRKVAAQLEDWPGANEFTIGLRDVNGNKCGSVSAEHQDEE